MSRETHFMQWVHYYALAEAYDRTLPGGWSTWERNTWQPDPKSLGRCNRYANRLRLQIPPGARKDTLAMRAALDFVARHFTRETSLEEVIAMAENTP